MKRKVILANHSDARDRAEAQFDKTQKTKDVGEKAPFRVKCSAVSSIKREIGDAKFSSVTALVQARASASHSN
jgi:hypothetical protein